VYTIYPISEDPTTLYRRPIERKDSLLEAKCDEGKGDCEVVADDEPLYDEFVPEPPIITGEYSVGVPMDEKTRKGANSVESSLFVVN